MRNTKNAARRSWRNRISAHPGCHREQEAGEPAPWAEAAARRGDSTVVYWAVLDSAMMELKEAHLGRAKSRA